jgi:acyl-CoA thioesterase-1
VSLRSGFIIAFCCAWLALGAGSAAASPTILVVGDSLSASYGIRVEQGWVALLADRLRREGYGHEVVNASATGETTGGALARLPRALAKHHPSIVVIELGGNDGLRGLPVPAIEANLESMIGLSRQSGARVLLVGMRMPPNYGPEYTRSFDGLYHTLAERHRLPLVAFLLDGVAQDDALMQADGIHPNAMGQPRLLDNVWPKLRPLLASG